jgi:hypothetical protein
MPLFLLSLVAVALAPEKAAPPQICSHLARNFARKAELPAGAMAALGIDMAERGAPWNATDAVGPGPLLPFDRFISAHQAGCTLTINWEHGGIAHFNQSAVLVRRGNRWVVTSRH